MANRRSVQRRTVMAYLGVALVNLERGISAALRSSMTEKEHTQLVKAYRYLNGSVAMVRAGDLRDRKPRRKR